MWHSVPKGGAGGRRRHGKVAGKDSLLLHAGHSGHGDLCHEGSEVEATGGASGAPCGGEERRVGSVEGRAGEVRLEAGNVDVERSA